MTHSEAVRACRRAARGNREDWARLEAFRANTEPPRTNAEAEVRRVVERFFATGTAPA